MLGHIGQEPDARLQRGARYQPQRGLVQIGAIGKRCILPGINQRVHNHPFAAAGSPLVPACSRPFTVSMKVTFARLRDGMRNPAVAATE